MEPNIRLYPEDFATTITDLHGEHGLSWLEGLPLLLRDFEKRWSLKIQPHFTPLSYNFVAPAITRDGSEVVVKAGYPNAAIQNEIASLEHFNGLGCIKLLNADSDQGVMLLEKVTPGDMLSTVADDVEATSIACETMRNLRKSPPIKYNYPSIADWGKGFTNLRKQFKGGHGPFPPKLIHRAEAIFRELLNSANESVLLHGDLHHYNILCAGNGSWMAVDPQGVTGEVVYETGAFLRNPYPQLLKKTNPRKILSNRIDLFTEELGFDRDRIAAWGFAQAVLSAWWSYEDHGTGWEWGVRCAEVLANI
ncbi:MAG: hypothetical protein HN590_05900 [Calditrichaeota bacterium]|jgi:streptomycin 6-kinase|nr:hypothetical protein [Calditrichota bacterium]MBT7789711.1 hypothetical protein [Calditrichota bacterium]